MWICASLIQAFRSWSRAVVHSQLIAFNATEKGTNRRPTVVYSLGLGKNRWCQCRDSGLFGIQLHPRGPMTQQKSKPAAGTILLAEDEPLLRELGQTILTQSGYSVLTAVNGEALRKLISEQSDSVDLLLTDVVMPDISGPDLVRFAKQRWPNIRVLYMSGYGDEDLKDLDRDAGFIQKPFTPTELMAKIREVLGTKI